MSFGRPSISPFQNLIVASSPAVHKPGRPASHSQHRTSPSCALMHRLHKTSQKRLKDIFAYARTIPRSYQREIWPECLYMHSCVLPLRESFWQKEIFVRDPERFWTNTCPNVMNALRTLHTLIVAAAPCFRSTTDVAGRRKICTLCVHGHVAGVRGHSRLRYWNACG